MKGSGFMSERKTYEVESMEDLRQMIEERQGGLWSFQLKQDETSRFCVEKVIYFVVLCRYYVYEKDGKYC